MQILVLANDCEFIVGRLLDKYLESSTTRKINMIFNNDSLISIALKDKDFAHIFVILQNNKHRNWNSGYILDSNSNHKATFKWYYSIGMPNREFGSKPFSFYKFLEIIQKNEIFIENVNWRLDEEI